MWKLINVSISSWSNHVPSVIFGMFFLITYTQNFETQLKPIIFFSITLKFCCCCCISIYAIILLKKKEKNLTVGLLCLPNHVNIL